MFTVTGPEFYVRVTGNPIFKEENREVRIYVYINSACFYYFSISTKDPIWKNPNHLFEKLSNGKVGINTFLYFFVNSETGDVIEEENIITTLEKLQIK